MTPALLALEDGSLFHGFSIGIDGESVGEVVFNTAMTGYQEILTDPSYARQIITLTYPQIGNTGINPEDMESDRVWASGLVIRQTPRRASNWRMQETLQSFLERELIQPFQQKLDVPAQLSVPWLDEAPEDARIDLLEEPAFELVDR